MCEDMAEAPVKVALEGMIVRKCSLGLCLMQINPSERVGQCRYPRSPGISVKGQGMGGT